MGYNKRARLQHGSRGTTETLMKSNGAIVINNCETGENTCRPENFPHRWIYGTDLYAPVLLNPTAKRKEESVNYAVEKEKLEVLKRRLARLEAKQVITSVDEIGMKFIHEEMERISSRLPKDWDQFVGG